LSQKHLIHCTNELLKSLTDGFELRTSAAEFILAFENMKKSPADPLYLTLKRQADEIIKQEDDETFVDADYDIAEGEGLLLATHHTHGEPTNHVWKDGLASPDDPKHRMSTWPSYFPKTMQHSHQNHNFPFHEANHPLLRQHAVTGMPHFVEMLRSHSLGGKIKEEKEMEKDFFSHLPHDHPIKAGYTAGFFDKKNTPLMGNISINGSTVTHQDDMYERDYKRWLMENTNQEESLVKEGYKPNDIEKIMRERHFDDRAKDWISEDIDPVSGLPTALGHMGYMLGLEWLNPAERNAVLEHLDDVGVDKYKRIKLPNGESIPTTRLTYNALMRMTPEMNWAIRPNTHKGRNAHMYQENNETDYNQGEGIFLRQSLGMLSHAPLVHMGGASMSEIVLDKLHEMYEMKDGRKRLTHMPKLDLHKGNPMDELEWEQLQEATAKHFNKNIPRSQQKIRMSFEDLLHLGGYDPNTRQLIQDHPLYGNLDEPVIPLEDLETINQMAKDGGSLKSKIKDVRKHRGFFTSVYGPHPDKEKASYWREDEYGDFTFGPGKFWSSPFQSKGGASIALPTYLEAIHANTQDNNGDSFLFDLSETSENYIQPRDNMTSLINHFLPERTSPIGEYVLLSTPTKAGKASKVVGGRFVHNYNQDLLQNLLSPFNTSRVVGGREGMTDKNNYTEHKSSLSPQYEYALRNMNAMQRKELGKHREPSKFPVSIIPTMVTKPEMMYGASTSDSRLLENAQLSHFIETLGGQMQHPHTPAEKSIMSYKDLMRGDEAVSGGITREDFTDYMGWGTKLPNFQNLKNQFMNDKTLNSGLRIINAIAKLENTNNPSKILRFLENDEKLLELKNTLGYSVSDELPIKSVYSAIDSLANTMKERGDAKNPTRLDSISHMLGFGGAMPMFEEETKLNDEIDKINEQLTGAEDPTTVEMLREQLAEKSQQLQQVQQRSMTKVMGKPSSYWQINADYLNDVASSHRKLVAEVARDKIVPAMLEADPNAFDASNPATFIANNARAFRDAQRYISSVPHRVHGLTVKNYGIGTQIRENKGKSSFHTDLAQHLSKKGTVIDGNMSVPQVLDALGIKPSTKANQHAKQLIDSSNKFNTPLMVSTIGGLLRNNAFKDIRGASTEHLLPNEELQGREVGDLNNDELFNRLLHQEDYHSAMDALQPKLSEGDWKKHYSHQLPSRLNLLMNQQQFGHDMLAAGVGAIRNDIHGMRDLKQKGKGKTSAQTKNHLDTILHFNPTVLDDEEGIFTPERSVVQTAGMIDNLPVGAPNPAHGSLMDTFDAGGHHKGYELTPTVGCEFTADGQIVAGTNVGDGVYHSVPHELTDMVHGQDVRQQVWSNAPPPQYMNNAHQSMNYENYSMMSDNPSSIAMSEMTEMITSLLDPDILLTKSDEASWTPPVRPMHRIFDMNDLEHLRGFSGSWVVSKWYDGKRIVLVKNGEEITAYDENGKKKGLKKATKEAVEKLNDKNYTLDAILGEEELNIIDIINYDDNNISDMHMHERMKILRSQFDSQENVIVPGPHDTRMTDNEGLEDAIKSLKEDHDNILLRDNKSTYMKGERRHPKWVLLREARDFNFIVLDRRGKGPYTYQLGAGPLLDDSGLGNRVIEIKGSHYMDVGTAHNQQRAFKIGDIVRASITGVTKKNRKERPVYNVQFKEIEGEGEGEGAASTESLDLLTKSFAPVLLPHDIEVNDSHIQIIMKDLDVVSYEYEKFNDCWMIHSPTSAIGSLKKADYPVILAESLQPYWSPLAPLMIEGYLQKAEMDMPKKPTEEQMEEGSAGIIEEDDENRLLKPNMKKKALELMIRTLDTISKERMTWTGPKGLGIDMVTPDESPRGPTKLRDDATLPDFDGERKESDDEEKINRKERLNHLKISDREGGEVSLDYENDQPILS